MKLRNKLVSSAKDEESLEREIDILISKLQEVIKDNGQEEAGRGASGLPDGGEGSQADGQPAKVTA